jgi:hypothetical protein
MPQEPASHFQVRPAILRLRRFVERDLLPILIRPFEGAAEERPLTHGLTQIAATLRTMGIQPDDSIVKQIGSEFEVLFCAAAAPGEMNAPPHPSPIEPAKSISDLIRQPPRKSAATAALQRFITFCRQQIITRMRRSFFFEMDPIKSISNILREPAPLPESQSRETPAEFQGESTPAAASQPRHEVSVMAIESSTCAPNKDVKALSPLSRSLRAALSRSVVLCVEPILFRLRNYFLEPLHARLDDYAGQAAQTRAETERIQLQLKVIRADLEYLPKQIAQLEFRYQSFAKQLAELDSKFGILTDQLKNLESKNESHRGTAQTGGDPDAA